MKRMMAKSTGSLPDIHINSAVPISLAICEFHQGHVPRSIYHYGEPAIDDELIWAVITRPAYPADDHPICPDPSICYSSFQNLHYIAFYTSIPDISARGFSRHMAMLLICGDKEILYSFRGIIEEKLISFVKEMQQNALKKFVPNLQTYSNALSAHIINNKTMITYMNELQPILDFLGITPSPDSQAIEQYPKTYFESIRNNLQPLEEIMDLDKIISCLEIYVDTLMPCVYLNNISRYLYHRQNSADLDFGGLTKRGVLSQIVRSLLEKSDSRISLFSYLPSGILMHVAYVLMTGRTLIIQSSNFEDAKILGEKFSLFVPQYDDTFLHIFENEIHFEDVRLYSIVITPSFVYEESDLDSVGILDLDKGIYHGPLCTPLSLIWSSFSTELFHSEGTFILFLITTLQKISSAFVVEMSRWAINVPQSRNKFHQALVESHMNQCDEEIFFYWINVLVNKFPGKPILLSFKPLVGVGYVAHYY